MTAPTTPVQLWISVDEWRMVKEWMHVSLDGNERSPLGHFLLECEGGRRTWVTSDGTQTTVVCTEGPPARGLDSPDDVFSVLVHSRFFRHRLAQDALLKVTEHGWGRMQTLVTGGVEASLAEHPGDIGDWRQLVGSVAGADIEVERDDLIEACQAAMVIPWGADQSAAVYTWLSIRDGRLELRSPWVDFPDSVSSLPIVGHHDDTAPVLVPIQRLIGLIYPVNLPLVTLVLPDQPTAPMAIRAGDYTAVLVTADRWEAARTQLFEIITEVLGDEYTPDRDGAYRIGTVTDHQIVVQLATAGESADVRVHSVLAEPVQADAALYGELNAINTTARHVTLTCVDDTVTAHTHLAITALTAEGLGAAIDAVRDATERYAGVIGTCFAAPQQPTTPD